MNIINTLKLAFSQQKIALSHHRIDLICRLVCALLQIRSVNLRKLACSLAGNAKIESHYRRLQRLVAPH